MPNKGAGWLVDSEQGNPTKSNEVNNMIKLVKKFEVRKQGKPSQARRAITELEWRDAMSILTEETNEHDLFRKYLIPSLTKFQFHMMARINDSSQFQASNLDTYEGNDFALGAKLAWSKNVTEERDAPKQILLGANDPLFCTLIGLSVWIETFLSTGGVSAATPYVFGLNDDITVPAGGRKVKENIQNIFTTEIFSRPEFGQGGGLSSHSVRKFSRTHARRCGASKDDCDLRGRWRSARVSDVYEDALSGCERGIKALCGRCS